MAELQADGGRLYYEHYAGSGRPVVLVHGWAMSARCWDTVLPALLANGNEVAALDQRCCGHSDKDFDDVSADAIAGDHVRLIESLGLERPVLSGWSFGGAVAIEAASRLGDNLSGVVLTGGATPRFTSADDWPYGGTKADLEGTLGALASNRVETLRGVAQAVCHAEVSPTVVDWMWQIFVQTSPRSDDSLRNLGDLDQRELLGRLRVPVLLAIGRHDGFVPFDAVVESQKLFANSRLIEFSESGHAPFIEEADKYRSELIEFVNSL